MPDRTEGKERLQGQEWLSKSGGTYTMPQPLFLKGQTCQGEERVAFRLGKEGDQNQQKTNLSFHSRPHVVSIVVLQFSTDAYTPC